MLYTVTGATGFIGNNLARTLSKQNKKVRSIVRTGRTHTNEINDVNSEIRYADITKKDELREALEGTDVLFHLAAMVSIMPGITQKMLDINVEAAKNIVDLCFELNIKRLIYVSSVHAIAADIPFDETIDENTSTEVKRALGSYGQTKAMGLEYVLDAAKRGLDVVIVHPSGVFGHSDYGPSNFGQTLDFMYNGLFTLIDGKYNFIDVDDLVDAMIASVEKGRKGERYLLTGDTYTLKEFKHAVDDALGRKRRYIGIPFNLLYFFSFFAELAYRALPIKPVFTREALLILKSNPNFSNEKAKRELGLSITPLENTIDKYIKWSKEKHSKSLAQRKLIEAEEEKI